MNNYKNLIARIFANGQERQDRTGTGTISVFSEQLKFDLSEGFPLLTLKKVSFKNVLGELLWFLSGQCHNTKFLTDNGITIWNEWADETGDVGSIYGVQWRHWNGCKKYPNPMKQEYINTGGKDQIKDLINSLQNDPQSRRHIVTAWNADNLKKMSLPPCHLKFQCYVTNDKKLSMSVDMRSSDVFLGLPYNIASYALLVEILANICGLKVGELTMNLGDTHIYKNHVKQCEIMLQRNSLPLSRVSILRKIADIDNIGFADFRLYDYNAHPPINGEISV